MPITSLRLRNFQRHRSQRIQISPRVTTFQGETESGKSSAIRALRWLLLNDAPEQAPKFFSWGKSFCKVEAEIDGRLIARQRKDKGLNSYLLDDVRYDAVKRDVPEPIAKLLRLGEVNLQDQHDSAFWLADSPAAISKQLNKIINLEEIDTALSKAAAKLRRAKAEADVTRSRLHESRRARRRLNWVPEADASLANLESIDQELTETVQAHSGITDLIQEVERIDLVLERGSELTLIAQEWAGINLDIEDLDGIIEALEKTEDQERPDLSALEEIAGELEEVETELSELESLIEDIEESEQQVSWQKAELLKAEADLAELKRKVPTCATCGQPLPM